MSDNINPLELLKDEMENDDISIRVNAINRVTTICVLIGNDAIKNQLLPYLQDLIKKEEDEILFAIAKQLGKMGQFFNQIALLLPSLEILASVDETVVRDSAVTSLIQLSEKLTDNEVNQVYIPTVLKLATNQNNFTCRTSAVSLIYSIYPRAGKDKEKLRQKFWNLASDDDTPMIKRAITNNIGELSKIIEKDYLISELIPCFKQLAGDDKDEVRFLSLENLKHIAKCLTKEENKTHTLPIIIAATEDKSWRVRLTLSANFAMLAEAFGKEITDVSLINIFTQLLKDNENEVKMQSISSLSHFAKQISLDKLPLLIPVIQQLAKDSNSNVRSGVAQVIGDIIAPIGKDITAQKLLPLVQTMFSDENFEVRISIIQAASKYVQVAGSQELSTMCVFFKTLVEDPKWMVRAEVISGVADLAVFFQKADIFTKHLQPIYMQFLKDKTHKVREAGILKLKKIVQAYKQEWVSTSLIPILNERISKENSYTFRQTGFQSFEAASTALSKEFVAEKIVPIILKHYKDPVPNVKIVLSKILKTLSQIVTDKNSIKQALQDLANDPDPDVKYFSSEALSKL